MLTREEFLALLARLRGEGDPLDALELTRMGEYIAAHSEDREAVTGDELAEIGDQARALADDDDVTTEGLLAGVAVVEAIGTVEAARADADAAEQAQRDELRARLRGEDAPVAEDETPQPEPDAEPDGDGEDEGGDGEGEDAPTAEVPEPVAVPAAAPAAPPAPARNVPTALRRRSGTPRVEEPAPRHNRILRDGGGEFASTQELSDAMLARRQSMLSFDSQFSEKVVVGQVIADTPDDRVLDTNNPGQALSRQEAVIAALHNQPSENYDAAVASGGLCAPAVPYYDIMQLAEAMRPFAASLQRFSAPRGRIIFREPPDFPDFASAVGVWTENNDRVPGSDGSATKPCLVVPCPGTGEAEIYAVTECLKFGNFMARTDPETVQNAVENTAAAFARRAEVLLINAVKAASTAVTAGNALGAARDLLYAWGVAAAGYRSRHRMRPDAVLEIRAPAWVPDMIALDLLRSMPGDGTMVGARAIMGRFLAENNLRIAGLYVDSPTGANQQVFGPQNATGLVDFPSMVQWQMSSPGSFFFFDNGRLDLGVVRDSTLIATNDYITFMETFEGLAFVGLESLWVTSEVCPNGSTSGTVDPSGFCTGDYVPA